MATQVNLSDIHHEWLEMLEFHKYLVGSEAGRNNPETGQPWGDAETPQTIDLEILRSGQPLTEQHVERLVAFLRTLTDQSYEHLLGD